MFKPLRVLMAQRPYLPLNAYPPHSAWEFWVVLYFVSGLFLSFMQSFLNFNLLEQEQNQEQNTSLANRKCRICIKTEGKYTGCSLLTFLSCLKYLNLMTYHLYSYKTWATSVTMYRDLSAALEKDGSSSLEKVCQHSDRQGHSAQAGSTKDKRIYISWHKRSIKLLDNEPELFLLYVSGKGFPQNKNGGRHCIIFVPCRLFCTRLASPALGFFFRHSFKKNISHIS